MKKLIMVALLFVLMVYGPSSALEYGADVNRGPCATNYNRVAPGLCVRNPPLQLISTGSGCETYSLSSEIPANAKTIGVSIFASMDNDGTPNTFLDGTISIYNGDNTTCSAGNAQHFQYQFHDSAGVTGTVFGVTIKADNIFLNGSRNLNYEKTGTIGGETPFLTQYTD